MKSLSEKHETRASIIHGRSIPRRAHTIYTYIGQELTTYHMYTCGTTLFLDPTHQGVWVWGYYEVVKSIMLHFVNRLKRRPTIDYTEADKLVYRGYDMLVEQAKKKFSGPVELAETGKTWEL